MKKSLFLKLIILSFMGCYPTQHTFQGLSSRFDCDLTPLWLDPNGSGRFHITEKQTFFVSRELIEIADEANKNLSDIFGVELFKIKPLKDDWQDGNKIIILLDNKIPYIYKDDLIMSRYIKNQSKQFKGKNKGANLSVRDYNRSTGEILESHIWFNPIAYYDLSREYLIRAMMHEMGHALGLPHINDKENLMYHSHSRSLFLTDRQIDAVLCRFKKN